jgi:DNA-binding helix-hairpin-helix protein with protein kinase domain/Flp pilus assembly protein TadD
MNRVYYNSRGQTIRIGKKIGRGGEATVFEIHGDSTLVAKIYHRKVNSEKAAKLKRMVTLVNNDLLKLTSWPVDLLYSTPYRGNIVGVLIKRINGYEEIHQLYTPRSRRQKFATADWRFLIFAATNVARAFYVLHNNRIIVGDVNEKNILISNDATVKLIDCDSFQIPQPDGRFFKCLVGVQTHTPPELQGKNFRNVERTQDHDNFGLAVIIFQLLMMGRHPFSGRFKGNSDIPIEKAIENKLFFYDLNTSNPDITPPPNAPSLQLLTNRVSSLFVQAFRNLRRPSSKEWVEALKELSSKLSQCRKRQSHYYLATLPRCPWCQIENATGTELFPLNLHIDISDNQNLSLAEIWKQMQSVPAPGPAPAILEKSSIYVVPSRTVKGAYSYLSFYTLLMGFLIIGVGIGVSTIYPDACLAPILAVGLISWFANSIFTKLRNKTVTRFETELHCIEEKWNRAKTEWLKLADDTQYKETISELTKLKLRYEALENERINRIERLKKQNANRQRFHFLDQFKIQDANIPDISYYLKAALRSFGIETAADITYSNVLRVPGIGQARAAKLEKWKESIEKKFVFDSTKILDPKDILDIDREIAKLRTTILSEMQAKVGQLKKSVLAINNSRRRLKPILDESCKELAQTEEDLRFLTKSQRLSKRIWLSTVVGIVLSFVIHGGRVDESRMANSSGSPRNSNLSASSRLGTNTSVGQNTNSAQSVSVVEAQRLYDYGITLSREKKFDEAVEVFQRAIELNNKFAEANHELGYALYRLKKFDDARRPLERAIELNSKNAESYYVLGLVLKEIGDYESATVAFRHAVDEQPSAHRYHLELGSAYLQTKRYADAERAFQNVLRLRPNNAKAHYELIRIYNKNGQIQEAESHCEELWALNSALASEVCDYTLR